MSGERSDEDEFVQLAGACLRRFVSQNAKPAPTAAAVEAVCRGIWKTALTEGFPKPLGPDETGTPGEMSAAEVNRLLGSAMAGVSWPAECPPSPGFGTAGAVNTAVRQLLKACLQPEFRNCRESYREVVKGKCRRQDLDRVRERISGSHCVDCPHWDGFPDAAAHVAFLSERWVGDPGIFRTEMGIFLPEDFRKLRRFLKSVVTR